VVKAETVNRKGKGEDGQARTREAKLGCIFTQTRLNEKGFPVRDEGSTSYVGAIEPPELFGKRLYREALPRAGEGAKDHGARGMRERASRGAKLLPAPSLKMAE